MPAGSNTQGQPSQKELMALQIRELEQKLIQRTSEVLKRTDLLAEFKKYKNEQLQQMERARPQSKNKNLGIRSTFQNHPSKTSVSSGNRGNY